MSLLITKSKIPENKGKKNLVKIKAKFTLNTFCIRKDLSSLLTMRMTARQAMPFQSPKPLCLRGLFRAENLKASLIPFCALLSNFFHSAKLFLYSFRVLKSPNDFQVDPYPFYMLPWCSVIMLPWSTVPEGVNATLPFSC